MKLSARRSPAVHKYFSVAKGHSRALLLCIIHNMQSSSLKTAAVRALITPVSLIMSVRCLVDTNARWPFFFFFFRTASRNATGVLLPRSDGCWESFLFSVLMDRGDSCLFSECANYGGGCCWRSRRQTAGSRFLHRLPRHRSSLRCAFLPRFGRR